MGDRPARRRVGLVSHPSSMRHVAHEGHPERPERLSACEELLRTTGLHDRLIAHAPAVAPPELVTLAHDERLLGLLADLDARGGGRIDEDTGMGPGSLEATLRTSQGTVDAAANVLEGAWDAAIVLMRPPGHHATRTRPMGFCLTNHVAIAARWAIASGKANRVLIVDWDAHHGNGTQDIFWTDPSVLYVSLHQYPWYPGTGDATEIGEGDGRGYTLNVPLPAGSAEDAYLRAFGELVEPAAAAFAPDLVLVSAGYDAHALDPLCMMRLLAGTFFELAVRTCALGPGPVCVLEGGYDLGGLATSVASTVSALLGDPAPTTVPGADLAPLEGVPEVGAWIDRAAALRRRMLGGDDDPD